MPKRHERAHVLRQLRAQKMRWRRGTAPRPKLDGPARNRTAIRLNQKTTVRSAKRRTNLRRARATHVLRRNTRENHEARFIISGTISGLHELHDNVAQKAAAACAPEQLCRQRSVAVMISL